MILACRGNHNQLLDISWSFLRLSQSCVHQLLEPVEQCLVARGKEMLEPALGLEPFSNRFFLVLGIVVDGPLSILHFIERPVAGIDRKPGKQDRVVRLRPPARGCRER